MSVQYYKIFLNHKHIFFFVFEYAIYSASQCNGGCDVCKKGLAFDLVNFTNEAKIIMNAVRDCNNQRTIKQVITMVRGGKAKIITKFGLDRSSSYGSLKSLKIRQIEAIIHKMVRKNK